MKIICEDKTVDLNKFEKIEWRESFFGSNYGYPVEAVRHEAGGIFGGSNTVCEEIARLNNEEYAKKLVEDITSKWIEGQKSFDLNEWLERTKR